jgi:hypothetical protein
MRAVLTLIQPTGPALSQSFKKVRLSWITDGRLHQEIVKCEDLDIKFLKDRCNQLVFLERTSEVTQFLYDLSISEMKCTFLGECSDLKSHRRIKIEEFIECLMHRLFSNRWKFEVQAIQDLTGKEAIQTTAIRRALVVTREQNLYDVRYLTLSNSGKVHGQTIATVGAQRLLKRMPLDVQESIKEALSAEQRMPIFTPEPALVSALDKFASKYELEIGLATVQTAGGTCQPKSDLEKALSILAGWLGDYGCEEVIAMRLAGANAPAWNPPKDKPIVDPDFTNRWSTIFDPPPTLEASVAPARNRTPTLQVVEKILRGKGNEHKSVVDAWARLEAPLPLMPIPPLEQLVAQLENEFPWMLGPIEFVARELTLNQNMGKVTFRMPPILLVGPPGCGKTRFAQRLAQLAGLPTATIAGAMSTDTRALSGTARGWSSAQPGLPLVLMATSECANPVVIVDELEKAKSNHNGDLKAALLGLLEVETSTRHFDECLTATCDLSQISWVATANDHSLLPRVLLSRFSVHQVAQPSEEHFDPVLRSLSLELAAEFGVDPMLLPPLDQETIEVLRGEFAAGRSVRDLSRAHRAARGAGAQVGAAYRN